LIQRHIQEKSFFLTGKVFEIFLIFGNLLLILNKLKDEAGFIPNLKQELDLVLGMMRWCASNILLLLTSTSHRLFYQESTELL
jgi:hypothetical protein